MQTIREEHEDLIRELFDTVDLDASGFIDEHELAAVVDLHPSDLKEIFMKLDTDQDGRISVEEFMENYKHFQTVAKDNHEKLNHSEDQMATSSDKIQTDEEVGLSQYDSGYSMSEPTHRKSRPPLKSELKRNAAKHIGQEYLDDLYEIARSRNDPMLLESLESFLAATVDNLLQKQSDNEKLDTALKRATEKNSEIANELEQEMEQQVAMLEEKIRHEEQRKLDSQKHEARKQIEEAQSELQAMEQKVNELEQRVVEKESQPAVPDAVIDEIQKKDEENKQLRNQLTEFQTQMALMRTEVAQMKAEYDEQADRLINERGTVLSCVSEQENLTRQLHLLHDANKKLHDTNDDLRSALESNRVNSFSNSPLPSPMKRSSSMGFAHRRPQTLFNSFRSDPGGFRETLDSSVNPLNDLDDTDEDSRHSMLPHDEDVNEQSLMMELMNAEAKDDDNVFSTPARKSTNGGTFTPQSVHSVGYQQHTPAEERESFVRQLEVLCDTNRRLGESNDELRQALSILSDQLRHNPPNEKRPQPTGAQSAPVTPIRGSKPADSEVHPQNTSSPRKVLLTKSGYHSLSTSRSMPDLSSSFDNHETFSVVNESMSKDDDDDSVTSVTTTQVETTENTEHLKSNSKSDKMNCQCGNNLNNNDTLCEICTGEGLITPEESQSVFTAPGEDYTATRTCSCDDETKESCDQCSTQIDVLINSSVKSDKSIQCSNSTLGENEGDSKTLSHVCEPSKACLCDTQNTENPMEKSTQISDFQLPETSEMIEAVALQPVESSMDDMLEKLMELEDPTPDVCPQCESEIQQHVTGIQICECNKNIIEDIVDSTLLTESDSSHNYSDQETQPENLVKRDKPVGESDEDATYEAEFGLSDAHHWTSEYNSSYSMIQNHETELSMFAHRQPDEESADEDDMDDEELVRLVDQTNDEEETIDSIQSEPITVEEKIILEPRGSAVGADTSSESVSASGSNSGLNDSHDRMFKIVLAGNAAVGKSSFIIRLCKNKFYSALNSTLGVDFQLKTMQVGEENVALQLWDTAGQERFRSIAKSYFRRVDGVILLYDVTCENSFLDVREWIESIESSNQKQIPVILCGNKIDLRPQAMARGMPVVSKEQGKKLADDIGALFVETSAKDGTNINRACRELTKQLQALDDEISNHGITLEPSPQKPKKTGCCRS